MRSVRFSRPLAVAAMLASAVLGGIVIAQSERSDRGVPAIDSSGNYEVVGIQVDVAGPNADAARQRGWREAQTLAWSRLWSRINAKPVDTAPRLSDPALDGIVAGIVVEQEEISARRYIARLGVLFDRARTGGLLGGAGGHVLRSAPMLVIPVEWSGGAPDSFEAQGPWQHAWARFRAGASPIDYVRPAGVGADSLLLNVGQAGRRGRAWWRMLLDQYGAADVLVPTVHVERRWPGGPIAARFAAVHGPDATVIAGFTLSTSRGDQLDALLDAGVRRIDMAYAQALREGRLRPDPSLVIEPPPVLDLAPVVAEDAIGANAELAVIQVDTPDAGAVTQAEQAFAGLPGVQASIASLAVGGTSSYRVSYAGGLATLRYLLDQRGWRLDDAGGGLRLRLRTTQDVPIPPPPPPPPPVAALPARAPAIPARAQKSPAPPRKAAAAPAR